MFFAIHGLKIYDYSHMSRYQFKKSEAKWNKKWTKDKTYEPSFASAVAKAKADKKASKGKPSKNSPKGPFYNLMMFPYPSAEGLHIGGVRTFTGVDIYGRLKRMQGHDVLEPMGLDGFGIHSENYALKIGKHPMTHAKDSEKNFYRQMRMLGNGFSWEEKLETYDPGYYRWTQWVFIQMFKNGLAYRKKQAVNWCPSCKTVLSDEQAEGGVCERCGSTVEKRDLEQWFFKITDYAERLLKNLPGLDWTEKIKIAQKNWVGKSEGATISFPLETKANYVFVHGFGASPENNFWPWLKEKIGRDGLKVQLPSLPNPGTLEIDQKIKHVLKTCSFSKDTVIVAHSLGCLVALGVLAKLKTPVRKLILISPPSPENKKAKVIDRKALWGSFNFKAVAKKAEEIVVLSDLEDQVVPAMEQEAMAKLLNARLLRFPKASSRHFLGNEAPEVLKEATLAVPVFTTRPDTLFGVTYLVLAPEHPLIEQSRSSIENYKDVAVYVRKSLKKKESERLIEGKDPSTSSTRTSSEPQPNSSSQAGSGQGKTGVELKGLHALHPITKKHIPIFVADYALGNYGTGAVMAVPAHDARDFAFAKKFKLPVKTVVSPKGQMFSVETMDAPYEVEGWLVNSESFDGLSSEEAKIKITKTAGGKMESRFRLRDWLISRQRYWGPPIPMIYCEECAESGQGERTEMPGWYTVPEKQLPVILPFVKNFQPKGTGVSPLATEPKFYKVKCPKCGSMARRETDVSDTFLDSSWYFLRYPSARNKKAAWDPKTTKTWLPVHSYIGGAEHSVLHLLYSRFVTMVFSDLGYLDFEEPFTKLRAHGLITKDGAKMSKSKGNVVNPDQYFEKFGADVMRLYLAFLAPLEVGGDFRDNGILGITRFLDRIWKKGEMVTKEKAKKTDPRAEKALHKAIKKVTEDIEFLRYNTAISALMIALNELEGVSVRVSDWKQFVQLLAPFAPYLAEELWMASGEKKSIHRSDWPSHDEQHLIESTVTIVLQINGKVRDSVEVVRGSSQREVEKLALDREKIKAYMNGGKPKKIIYVPNRLVNIVI